MGLLKIVGNALGFRVARKEIAENPVLRAALVRSSTVYDALPLKDIISKETSHTLSSQVLERVYGIINAANPVLKCREELTGAILQYAKYQVLILPPEPEEDPTELRGTQGVSGELKPLLLEIAEKSKDIKELMHGVVEKPTYDDVWNSALFHYWKYHWFAETFNACRIALNDHNPVDGKDWYKPFIHAMCVWEEFQYRKDLGMPSAISGDSPSLTEFNYSTFLDTVLSGAQYPDLDWKEQFKDAIEDGSLRPPF